MQERERLPERQDLFHFEYKASEVNYGGNTCFQQVAFPPLGSEQNHIEYLSFTAISHFAQLMEDRRANERQCLSSPISGLSEIYLELWGAIPQINFEAFQRWYNEDVQSVAKVYRQIKVNALILERKANNQNLSYLSALSVVSLISEIISDYFEKNIYRLGRLATAARWIIGRAMVLALLNVEDDPAIQRLNDQCHKKQEQENALRRLFNPFIIAINDASDTGLIEEILLGPNPYHLPPGLRMRVQQLFAKAIMDSSRFESNRIKRSLAAPGTYFKLVQDKTLKFHIINIIKNNDQLRTQMIVENEKFKLKKLIREILLEVESDKGLMLFASNEKRLSEILLKKPMLRQFLRVLKKNVPEKLSLVKQKINTAIRLIQRSKKSWFNKLNSKEIYAILEEFQERLIDFLAHEEDFKMLRARYGPNCNRGVKWLGLRLWRSYELVFDRTAPNDKERFHFNYIYDKSRIDIENNFAEGNLYLIRPDGEMYACGEGRRQTVIFLFADLRNSTETTMKLTKDTASYLTPYLNTVNKSTKACNGKRIYFAGDGFAAYFEKISDAIRAAYLMNIHFEKLRKYSGDEIVKKAKVIYQQATAIVDEINRPSKVREVLVNSVECINDQVKSFLTGIIRYSSDVLDQTIIKKLLAKTAAEYTMPRVDLGVALTSGELFNAIVDEEEKIPIVISPQLTQAARLSGSSDLVKHYIDVHFKPSCPFNVYAWDRKLYNRGIVLTEQVFNELKQETKILTLATKQEPFNNEKLFYYVDQSINQRIILRESQEPVMLKGIEEPCAIYEVAVPGSMLSKIFGKLEAELV